MKPSRPAKPLPTRHPGPNDSPGFLLWRVSNAWQREQRAALQPLGLTHTQFVMLAVSTWFGDPQPLTQAALAQLAGSDPMTTSQVVRTLVAQGWVTRESHPEDTRAKLIRATPHGRALAARAVQVVEAVDQRFFEILGADDRAALVKSFQGLLDRGEPAGESRPDLGRA
ncbi:MarR family transcriptional regulator [Pelomonas sp. CA6]|uniref:MarR family winged helix-turn-helix transcriptional regulator n=1 Tax=Pelomonas sp. CA6 TaxID=2907999 RepID=UPI001F4BD1DF|nr:MarR family transcriptional regulator [Pelomonas sp. CA6]MCH7343754.1 MarR family transcriptional regulator [Pelomonas sp. CA6]